MKSILLITPPFTQLNTPYPATAYLKGFLKQHAIRTHQLDLGIMVILELFSQKGLTDIFKIPIQNDQKLSENIQRIRALKNRYIHTIEAVMTFLQGQQPTLARQIVGGQFLPQASRFQQIDDLDWAFGSMGIIDKAKHLATLYLEDLSDYIIEMVDPHFGFSRYAERLGRSATHFDELLYHLQQSESYIDQLTIRILEKEITQFQPDFVSFSVPFPGNLYSAFRSAQYIKKHFPQIQTLMGGGFPNTELRSLKDPRVFDFFDFITLDDGERPLWLLLQDTIAYGSLKRTFYRQNNEVVYDNGSPLPDFKQHEIGTPDYDGLPLSHYISVIEIANPMHTVWTDGRWNKLTMAHGCYWGKCTFCDISLDYIKIYEPVAAATIVDRMEDLMASTHNNGFHFVDEAAPPALMKAVALEIIKRNLTVTWWTNIRFEKSFTQDLCYLLQQSGCIAVSGGLEVASDRLLQLIDKGVTVAQVAQVTHHFKNAGILVHAYLMYGYPTQTVAETIDSLEMVRQLFENDCLQSGFWHQFALTAHSPVGLDPEAYGILPKQEKGLFAQNDIQFRDKTGVNHDQFSFGLKKSLFNYMHGIGLDFPLQEWFDFKIPKTKIAPDCIKNHLQTAQHWSLKPNQKVYFLGNLPQLKQFSKTKKGQTFNVSQLIWNNDTSTLITDFSAQQGEWLINILEKIKQGGWTLLAIKNNYEENVGDDFELFWTSKNRQKLNRFGLYQL